jgi:hypothetical protein
MRIPFALALLLACFAVPAIAAPPVVNVSLNPATGIAPYASTLTWTVTGAVSCTASDGWTGSKAATGGTQSVTVAATAKYALTCVAADGKVTTSWTAPASNTDGTPYTDNAGYNVYRGTSPASLAKIKSVGPTITSIDDTGLASGTYVYAVTTVNASSLESAKSATATATVTGSSTTASATAAVQTIPAPPTGVKATVDIVAYEVRPNSTGTLVASRIGLIPMGSICGEETRTANGVTYQRVDTQAVDFINWPASVAKPVEAFGKCG